MRGLILYSLLVFSSTLLVLPASAQDTILLINGKTINGNILEVKESSVKYRIGSAEKSKIHSIKIYRVFSITKKDGSEQVIFKPDTLDEPDFNVGQLRMFIKGEQAAQIGYHDNLNMTVAFIAGVGASFFDFYGLVGPAIYSSIVGSVSPRDSRLNMADPALLGNADYHEGYLKKTRDKKIRNSFVAGMLGFAVGFTVQSIIGNNSK